MEENTNPLHKLSILFVLDTLFLRVAMPTILIKSQTTKSFLICSDSATDPIIYSDNVTSPHIHMLHLRIFSQLHISFITIHKYV
jgi:hypothetical protein